MSGLVRLDIWHDPSLPLHVAHPIADMLRAAGAAPRLCAGGPAPTDGDGIILLLGSSPTANCWVDARWLETVYASAVERGAPVLPVYLEACDVPDALSHLSFADFVNRNREAEEHRLLVTLAGVFGADRIHAPKLASDIPTSPPRHAIRLRLGDGLKEALDRNFTEEALPMMQDGLFFELGVPFPDTHLAHDAQLGSMSFVINLYDVEERREDIPKGMDFVNEHPHRLANAGYECLAALNPASGHLHAWVREADAPELTSKGLTKWSASGRIILSLSALLRYRASAFLDQTTVSALLDALRRDFPRLVETTVPGALSLAALTDVLRRLVLEGVSVQNIRRILIEIAEIAAFEKRSDVIADYLRAALKDMITHISARGQGNIVVILIDPSLEARLREALTWGETSSWLALEASEAKPIVDGLVELMANLPAGVQAPLVLTQLEIRTAIRRLIAASFPTIRVIAYEDIDPAISIQPIGRIGHDGVSLRQGFHVDMAEL